MKVTTSIASAGAAVNLEFDILGKYVERLFEVKGVFNKEIIVIELSAFLHFEPFFPI